MKDQHTKQTRSVVLSITAILLMLVISVMGFTAIVSADQEQWPAEKIGVENFLPGTGMSFDEETGSFTKEYDGTADANLTVNTQNNTIGIKPESVVAVFVDKDGGETSNVADATHIKVTYELADENVAAESLLLDAKITPSNDLVYTVTYNPYGIKTNGKNVTLTGVGGQSVTATIVGDLGVLNARADAYTGTGIVATNLSNPNYDPSAISVIVNRLEITGVDGKDKWDYGSTTTLFAEGADGVDYPATLVFTDLLNKAAWEKGNAGTYSLTLTSNYVWAEDASSTVNVTINRLEVVATPDTSVILGDGKNTYLPKLTFKCDNADLLAEALESITYTVDGQKFSGATYGDYTVTVGIENNNFVLADDQKNTYSDGMEVALKIRYESKTFEVVDEKTNEVVGIIILKSSGTEGFTDAVTVTAQSIKGYPKIVKSKYNMTYKISISGAEDGQTFTVYVPLNDDVMAPRTEGLENGLYLYEEATGKLVAAENAKLGDGYAEFAKIAGSVTLVIAPDYNAPFFQTVWGILLIVVLVLGLIALMCYIGLRLRRELETAEAPAMVIDTVGELPETEEAAAEETAEVDETAVLEETVEEIADSVEEATEEAVDEADEALNAVVEEVLDQLMAEAAEETLDEATEEVIEEVVATAAEEAIEEVAEEAVEEAAEEVVEEAAEEVVEEAAEEVVEEAAEEVVEEAAEEVVEEAAEEVVEEAAEEVVEAAAEEVVEAAAEEAENESDEDDDNSDDSNDDADGDDAVEAVSMVGEEATFGFGAGADLATFIDVKENPEAYQEMLAREARGEIKIVYRYKKSFQSKLAQSMGNVQDYYSELKNALLSFKGVKNRLSWNYEAFNKGRAHVAKMDAKSKTLYLYLALDPAQFADTKYSVVDVSAKRKYATTPTLIKIKGERKFKHALELIEKVCGEQMTLEKVEAENVDYRVARMTIEEMVDAGLMKQSAGYIVLPTEEV